MINKCAVVGVLFMQIGLVRLFVFVQDKAALVDSLSRSLDQLRHLGRDVQVANARLEELSKQAVAKRAQLQVGAAGGAWWGRGRSCRGWWALGSGRSSDSGVRWDWK